MQSPTTTTEQPYEGHDWNGYDSNFYDDGEDGGEPIDDGFYGEPEEHPQEFNGGNAGGRSLVDVASNAVSQCPVENGVMRTTWGAVAAGPLIAGMSFSLVEILIHLWIFIFFFPKPKIIPNSQESQPVWGNKMLPPWIC